MLSGDDVESGYLKTKKKLEERNRLKAEKAREEARGGKKKKKNKKGEDKSSSSCFSSSCFLLVLLCLLSVPIYMNFRTFKKIGMTLLFPTKVRSGGMEEYFTVTSNDIIGSQVLGASKDEVVGYIKAGKNCAVLYSDDPDSNDQALATRICPELHDADIYFHISGVFGTHPNKGPSDDPKVKFVISGTNVWTTFFDQHNSTRQMYTVPPSNEVNMSSLTGFDSSFLPPTMDTVKVVHSMYFIQRTRGIQFSWPHCISLYSSMNVVHSTHGYIICQQDKKSTTQVIDHLTMERLSMVDSRGEMPELAFIVPGPGASVKVSFEPDPDPTANPLPLKEVTIRPGRTSATTGNEVYDAEEQEGAEWKLRPKEIVITYAAGEDSGAGGEDADE